MARMSFEETMAWGAAQYADVLAALRAERLPAEFTQTDGMNATIAVPLGAGHRLLVTDAEDSLSSNPSDRQGWFVGLYDGEESGDPIRWAQDDDGTDVEDLVGLVRRVMHPAAR